MIMKRLSALRKINIKMKKALFIGLLFVSTSLFAVMDGLIKVKDYPSGLQQAKEQSKNIILFVYSDFCPYCDKMKSKTLSNKSVIRRINDKDIFIMENQNSPTLPAKFKKGFVPMTYIISYEDGEILQELAGYQSAVTLKNLLSDCVAE
jgi:thioredoxin-related protein